VENGLPHNFTVAFLMGHSYDFDSVSPEQSKIPSFLFSQRSMTPSSTPPSLWDLPRRCLPLPLLIHLNLVFCDPSNKQLLFLGPTPSPNLSFCRGSFCAPLWDPNVTYLLSGLRNRVSLVLSDALLLRNRNLEARFSLTFCF